MQNLTLDEIKFHITRLAGLRYQSLAFPPVLEGRFEFDTSERRCGRLWLEGLIVIALFNLCLIADYITAPDLFARSAVIRLGLVTPLALLVNVSMLFRPNKHLREAGIAAVACLAGLTHLYLESGRNPVTSAFAQFAIVAVILFSNTIMRLRLPYAVASTAIMLLGDTVFLTRDAQLNPGQKLLGLCLTLGCVAGTIISNYSFCREERLNYLLCLQGDMLLEQMSQANRALRLIAERDALTGLQNRHAFDRRLAHECERARRLARPLACILVDVDQFKVINDTYGHLYGDRVLKRIGHLLQESLRRKDDYAARFGGEEFVILLPDTPRDLALRVAERIRTLVQTAGLPALDSGTLPLEGRTSTISCGVAAYSQNMRDDPKKLVDAADLALYRAKDKGRNQVCAA